MRKTLKPFGLLAGMLGCVASAQAADLAVRYPAAPIAPAAIYAPIYNWTGFYLGITGPRFDLPAYSPIKSVI